MVSSFAMNVRPRQVVVNERRCQLGYAEVVTLSRIPLLFPLTML